MAKFVKCAEHDEIFKIENGQKCWIQDWSSFVFIAKNMKITWNELLTQVETIPFEELKDNYPVGETMLKKTVTTIVGGKKPRDIFYPEAGHQTDILYKMLYVCPWRADSYGWLDEIQEVGFNVVHSWWPSKAAWEKANDDILNELERRGMYGCVQLPKDFGKAVLEEAARKLGKHPNAFASPFEEPDGKEHPNKAEQKEICDIIKQASPELEIWLCLNWGPWKLKVSFYGVSLVMTDSYPFMTHHGSHPVPNTPAAKDGDCSLPFWTMAEIIKDKIVMIKEVAPADMPIINIGQGYYAGNNAYPNVEEEWKFYNDRLGLNSFAVYPHGQGQNFPSVMDDERIKNQCKELMKKLR